ncbi:MAG: hypothetical protein WKF88_01395 [Ferruginibacter sp.]
MAPIRIFFSVIICITAFVISCSPSKGFRKDKALFDASPEIVKYKAIADMNDAFFVLKENNFFEFYRQLFDSVKNSSYPGRYSKSGDTLLLNFYNKKGEDILGSKAIINQNKKEIIFFDHSPGGKKKLIFN